MTDIILPATIVCVTGLFLGLLLGFASKRLSVYSDPRIQRIHDVLPKVNCRACGYPGCMDFAKAIIEKKIAPAGCAPGGSKSTAHISEILGAEFPSREPLMAVIHCKGGSREAGERAVYEGINDCHAAVLSGNGVKICPDGCLGLGTCVTVCLFDALSINANGVAVVNPEACTGCGQCVPACPRNVIELIPKVHKIFLACSNHDRGPKVKKYCSVGCTTCILCVKATPSGTITIIDNLPKLDYARDENFIPAAYKCPQNCFVDLVKARPKANIDTKCDGCGECIPICPIPGAIQGEKGSRHAIDKVKCIGCGMCLDICHVHAISLWGGLGYSATDKRKWQRS